MLHYSSSLHVEHPHLDASVTDLFIELCDQEYSNTLAHTILLHAHHFTMMSYAIF